MLAAKIHNGSYGALSCGEGCASNNVQQTVEVTSFASNMKEWYEGTVPKLRPIERPMS